MDSPQNSKEKTIRAELQQIIKERETLRIKLLKQYYNEEVMRAKENGKTVIYTPGQSYGELFNAFDDCIAIPQSDNYAVYTCNRQQQQKYLESSESRGLSQDVCSYDRVAAGLMFEREGAFGALPEPDLIVGLASACDTHAKYWEIVSDHYGGVPYFPFDMPYQMHDEKLPDYAIEYGASQIRQLADFITEHTGKKLNWDRFRESARKAVETITYYMEKVVEPRVAVPSPWSTIQTMADTFFLITYLGRPEAKQFFELVAKEIAFRVKHEIGINPNEKYRLLYTDLPPWFWTGLLKLFHEKGGTLAIECYPTTFWLGVLFNKYNDLPPIYDMDPDKPDEAMAFRFINMGSQRNHKHTMDSYVKATEKYQCDGAVFFANRTCAQCTRAMPLKEKQYRERTGLPTMFFQGEHCDDRTFSQSQTLAKVDAFFETLERQKSQLSMV